VVTEEIVVSSNELQIVVFSHQATTKGISVFSDQPIGEQNVGPSELRHQKQNVASSDMKIKNWCIKQSIWTRSVTSLDMKIKNCGLELTSMTMSNVDWKFRSKNDGLDWFRLNVGKKKLYKLFYI